MKKHSNSTYSSQSSSSSSSSSSSTNNFNPTMCNSKNSNAGCLSAILRKILCSGGLPTHPSDQIRDLDSKSIVGSTKGQNFKIKHHPNSTTSTSSSSTSTITTTSTSSTSTSTSTSTIAPNIVARLMGLDSMVEAPSISLSRSKSMNSVDCLGECNRIDDLHHKRVNSTLSFREVPTFLLLENNNFFVLSFEGKGKESKFKSNVRKIREMGKGKESVEELNHHKEKNKIREKRCFYDENFFVDDDNKGKMGKRVCALSCGSVGNGGKLKDITNTCSDQNKGYYYEERNMKNKKCYDSEARKLLSWHKYLKEEVVVGEKMKSRRRRKKRNCCNEKKLEVESKSEQDSSPVSVLDFEREPCGTVGLSSRRKLSPDLENDKKVLPRSDGNLMIEERKINAIENNKCEGSKKKLKHSKEYKDIWGQVCKIAEDELAESILISAWKNKQDYDLGSISADFELGILDQLLNELVDQIVEDPVTTL